MNNVPANRVNDFYCAKVTGDFYWSGDPVKRLSFLCPCGCGSLGGINVSGDPKKEPVWKWNGDLDKPTISPSVRFLGGCKWHGHLINGVFVTCDD